jgi:prepilin-type N-terminal cleavage/methylation domain-containing protein
MTSRQAREEQGFTLIELVASIAILTIIIGAITAAMIVFLKTGGEASRRDDHSSGSATTASYLNRDLASASSASTTASTTCSGKSNKLVLAWVDYTATPASPSPAPAASGYTVAYAMATDADSTTTDHAPRFQLERWYCAPGMTASSAVVLRDIVLTSDFTVTSSSSAQCPGGRYTVVLKRYAADAGPDYASNGCLKGRTG